MRVVVSSVNANLMAGVDLTKAHKLNENAGKSFIGDMKKGKFEINADTASEMILVSGNPNGRPNTDVVRPWVNALDIARRPRDMWIIDFDMNMSEYDAAQYERPAVELSIGLGRNQQIQVMRFTFRSAELEIIMRRLPRNPQIIALFVVPGLLALLVACGGAAQTEEGSGGQPTASGQQAAEPTAAQPAPQQQSATAVPIAWEGKVCRSERFRHRKYLEIRFGNRRGQK